MFGEPTWKVEELDRLGALVSVGCGTRLQCQCAKPPNGMCAGWCTFTTNLASRLYGAAASSIAEQLIGVKSNGPSKHAVKSALETERASDDCSS